MASSEPNLFIVGAAKAGTTSLHEYLDAHPDVYMSQPKEPHFFSRLRPSPERRPYLPTVDSEEGYLRLFRGGEGHAYRGESSTSYLTVGDAAERIGERCPEAKVVIALRDPVARAHSHYLADRADGVEGRTFAEAIEEELSGRGSGQWGVDPMYVEIGRYAEPAARYQRLFGDRLEVVFFEELTADPSATVDRLLAFLELDSAQLGDTELDGKNPYSEPRGSLSRRLFTSPMARLASRRVLPRAARVRARGLLSRPAEKPELRSADAERLAAHYESDVERLTELLGRRPPWPRFAGNSAMRGDESAGQQQG